jgi:hypothetical protein
LFWKALVESISAPDVAIAPPLTPELPTKEQLLMHRLPEETIAEPRDCCRTEL